ncbi:hypothetical protein [Paraburkholderia hospita]|uniref:hypothetical protein n=1 Tax=Paraburkholderia hospita TaxID=169430 RepID=UPI00104056AC|nr:hypothetical protein [Paraburkholderia hospita]
MSRHDVLKHVHKLACSTAHRFLLKAKNGQRASEIVGHSKYPIAPKVARLLLIDPDVWAPPSSENLAAHCGHFKRYEMPDQFPVCAGDLVAVGKPTNTVWPYVGQPTDQANQVRDDRRSENDIAK